MSCHSVFILSILSLVAASPPRWETANRNTVARATTDDSGWGLTVLSQKSKLPTPVTEEGDYSYFPDSGEGVDVYVVDSGINRIDALKDITIHDEYKCLEDTDFSDTRDHGTRIAALIASPKYGVAKKPTLYNYKVDGSDGVPTKDCVVAAFKQITDKVRQRKTASSYKGSVINLSVNLQDSGELQSRVEIAISQGIAVVTTPGNKNEDSRKVYPCAYEDVICVGAVDKNYDRWQESSEEGSGYGSKVTLLAPGKDLTSYSNEGEVKTDVTATSFAAPLVVGIVATYYGFEGPLKLATVFDRLNANNENNMLSRLRGSPNKLANNGYLKAGGQDSKPYIDAGKGKAKAVTTSTTSTSSKTTASLTTPSPTSKMVIALDYQDLTDFTWDFFTAPIKQTSFDFCSPYTTHTFTPPATSVIASLLPTGTFSIGTVGKQESIDNCVYTRSGSGNGTMSCDGVGGFFCKEIDGANYNKGGDCTDESAIFYKIQCQW